MQKSILCILFIALISISNTSFALVNAEREHILEATNTIRAGVGVIPMRYSLDLEKDAQKWANTLAKAKSMYHASWEARKGQGENLYAYATTATKIPTKTYDVINAWADEQNSYDSVNNSCATGAVCGHYTQLVWKNTTEMGCAKKEYRDGKWKKVIWVCRYNPAGNYEGERPY